MAAAPDPDHERWTRRRKHVFMLSVSGKPIFSRYGDALELSGFMGVIPALMAKMGDNGLRTLMAGNQRCTFVDRDPIYLLAVTSTGEPREYIEKQLDYIYHQVLFVLTGSVLTRLRKRPNYDVRDLMGDSDAAFRGLIHTANHRGDILFDAAPSVLIKEATRARATAALRSARVEHLLYGLLLTRDAVVAAVQPANEAHRLPPPDLVMLLNVLRTNRGLEGSESWIPLCLPHFNTTGHVHAFTSFLSPSVILVYISTQGSSAMFHALQRCRERVVESLSENNGLPELERAVSMPTDTADQVGIPGLLHFAIHRPDIGLYYAPAFAEARQDEKEQKRIWRRYQVAHGSMEVARGRAGQYCDVEGGELVHALAHSDFELIAAFDAIVSPSRATELTSALVDWSSRVRNRMFPRALSTWT